MKSNKEKYIKFTDRNDEIKYFATNQEAKKYFDDIKNKCKECGNDLK